MAATPDRAGKAPTSVVLSVAGACSEAAVLQAGPVVLSHEGDKIVLGAGPVEQESHRDRK